MSEIKLLPCPFCGGEARMLYIHEELGECCVDSAEELEDETISAFIHCYGCSTEVFPREAEKPKDVIEAWNTRKPIDDMVERLEKELELADEEKRRCVVENPLQFDSAKGYAIGISNALEIVRNGEKE